MRGSEPVLSVHNFESNANDLGMEINGIYGLERDCTWNCDNFSVDELLLEDHARDFIDDTSTFIPIETGVDTPLYDLIEPEGSQNVNNEEFLFNGIEEKETKFIFLNLNNEITVPPVKTSSRNKTKNKINKKLVMLQAKREAELQGEFIGFFIPSLSNHHRKAKSIWQKFNQMIYNERKILRYLKVKGKIYRKIREKIKYRSGQ